MTSLLRTLLLLITIAWLVDCSLGEKPKMTSKTHHAIKQMTSRSPLKSRTRLFMTSPTPGLRSKGKSRVTKNDDSPDSKRKLDSVYVELTKPGSVHQTSTLTLTSDDKKAITMVPVANKASSRTKSTKNSQRNQPEKPPKILLSTSPMTSAEVTKRRPEVPNKSDTCREQCDTTRCESVAAESCNGRVVKDHCNCCPVCDSTPATSEANVDIAGQQMSHLSSNVCESLTCPKNKVCILNIQGIPMCRCPNVYACKNADKRPLCSVDGVTFKNKCFLKAEECAQGRKMRIAHKGSCRTTSLEAPASPDHVKQLDQPTTEIINGGKTKKMASRSKQEERERQKWRQAEKTKSPERRNNKKQNFA